MSKCDYWLAGEQERKVSENTDEEHKKAIASTLIKALARVGEHSSRSNRSILIKVTRLKIEYAELY